MNSRKNMIFFVLVCLVVGSATAGPVPASGQSVDDVPGKGDWEMALVSSSAEEVVIDVWVDGFDTTEVVLAGTTYQRLSLVNAGTTLEVGKPELPVIGRFVAVPPGASVRIEAISQEQATFDGFTVYPAQEPPPDCDCRDGEPPPAMDRQAYGQDVLYPETLVDVSPPQTLRHLTVVRLEVRPLQFNPARGELRFTGHVRVRLAFEGGAGRLLADDGPRAGESFRDLCRAFVINCDDAEAELAAAGGGFPADPVDYDYLIITDPALLSAANTLAAWRNGLGMDTVVRTTGDTGTTANGIKGYIYGCYLSWPSLSYVLLLGDVEAIPVHYVTTHPEAGDGYPAGHKTGTDLYYATMGPPGDVLPDVHVGRIPVDTLADANHVVDRIVAYEQSPSRDVGFYERAAVAGQFQDDDDDGEEDRLFIWTSETIRDHLVSEGYDVERIYWTDTAYPLGPRTYNSAAPAYGALLPSEILKGVYPWNGSGTDIVNAVNEGVFILNHRDHGSVSGWAHPPFDAFYIAQLANGAETPVVFSINCETGWFDSETDGWILGGSDPCFAERFLRYGSSGEDGAVGVFAATRVSYSWYNDEMARGFYDAVWQDFLPLTSTPSRRMGHALSYGKVYFSTVYGISGIGPVTTLELFHYLGDPAMEIRTEPPYVAASFPFYDSFESGTLDEHWMTYTTVGGRVEVTSTYAYTGTYGVALDDAIADAAYSYAPLILTIDLSGQSAVDLDFWWREFTDENDAEDGVFVSDDYGETWHQAFSFNGGAMAWQNSVVDVDAAAAAHGLALNDHFQLKFQFYDNYPIDLDGYVIDDVSVEVGDVEPTWYDDVEDGVYGWSADGLWHRVDEDSSPYPESRSPDCSWWYGQDGTGDYYTGATHSGGLTSPPMLIAPSIPTPTLTFWHWYEVGAPYSPFYDNRYVEIVTATGSLSYTLMFDPQQIWHRQSIDLSDHKGETIQVRFTFDTGGPPLYDGYRGWYVDDVWLTARPLSDVYLPLVLRSWE